MRPDHLFGHRIVQLGAFEVGHAAAANVNIITGTAMKETVVEREPAIVLQTSQSMGGKGGRRKTERHVGFARSNS